MTRKKFISASIAALLLLVSCTDTGEVYDKSKHSEDQFSGGNTFLAILGAVAVVAVAAEGGGGYGAITDYDWDWDYLPRSRQWACRGIQTGEFAELYHCRYDSKTDRRWPN